MNYEFKEPCASCGYSSIYVGDEIHLDSKTLMPTIHCGHEEVCERLHNYQDDVCDVPEEGTGTQSLYCSHEQICSKLKEYEEKEKFDVLKNRKKQDIYGTWISVDDHLPDKDKYDWVLVQTWIDDVKGYFGVPHVAELRDGKWYDTHSLTRDMESAYMIKVTHWMPLPPWMD